MACGEGTWKEQAGPEACEACGPGYFQPVLASNTACSMCSAGTYSLEAASACTTCPDQSHSPAGSINITNCTCNAGYTGPDGGPCVSCGEGTWKEQAGPEACEACGPGYFQPVLASKTACSVCSAGAAE